MLTMKKTAIASAIGLAFGLASVSANASVIMTFADNTTPVAAPLPYTIAAGANPVYTSAFAPGNEFRMISPVTGTPGGGGEKSIYNGGEQWIFNSAGQMSGVTGTPSNPGASFPGSAAPTAGTNPTLNQNAPFFGPAFNFLAPTTTSLAGTAYGPATVSVGTGGNFSVHFNVMEAQWGGTWFPLGQDGGIGVTFNCSGGSSFTCFAEHKITVAEDPGSAGFAGWVAQWEVHGTASGLTPAPVPLPAAAWLFGSGLLGLVGIARRKKSA